MTSSLDYAEVKPRVSLPKLRRALLDGLEEVFPGKTITEYVSDPITMSARNRNYLPMLRAWQRLRALGAGGSLDSDVRILFDVAGEPQWAAIDVGQTPKVSAYAFEPEQEGQLYRILRPYLKRGQ